MRFSISEAVYQCNGLAAIANGIATALGPPAVCRSLWLSALVRLHILRGMDATLTCHGAGSNRRKISERRPGEDGK